MRIPTVSVGARRFAALSVLILAGFASLATSQSAPVLSARLDGQTILSGTSPVSVETWLRLDASTDRPGDNVTIIASIHGSDHGTVRLFLRLSDEPVNIDDERSVIKVPSCYQFPCAWPLTLDVAFDRAPLTETVIKWTLDATIPAGYPPTGSLSFDRLPSGQAGTSPAIADTLRIAIPAGAMVGLILGILGVRTRRVVATSAALALVAAILLLASTLDAGTETAVLVAGVSIFIAMILWGQARSDREDLTLAARSAGLLLAVAPGVTLWFADAALVRPLDVDVFAAVAGALAACAGAGFATWVGERRSSQEPVRVVTLIAVTLAIIVAATMSAWCFALAIEGPNILRVPAVLVAAPASGLLLVSGFEAIRGERWGLFGAGLLVLVLSLLSTVAILLGGTGGTVIVGGSVAPEGLRELWLDAAAGIGFGAITAGILGSVGAPRQRGPVEGWPPMHGPNDPQ